MGFIENKVSVNFIGESSVGIQILIILSIALTIAPLPFLFCKNYVRQDHHAASTHGYGVTDSSE